MHCATARQWVIVCAEGCVVEPGRGRPPGVGVLTKPDCAEPVAGPVWRLNTNPALTSNA